jgi:hypothetical protein
MLTLLAVALFAAGHLVRDGVPVMGKTLAARYAGLVLCVMGAAVGMGTPLWGLLAGLATGVGYWLDQRHGEGQWPEDWRDARDLAISGITSLALLAVVLGFYVMWQYGVLVLLVGALGKPAIWFAARYFVPVRLYPTRVAAGVFGALVGLVVALA